MATRTALPTICLLGVVLDNLTTAEALDRTSVSLVEKRGGWVFTPNLDILRRLTIDPEYATLTSAATLRLADGMPLVWASRLQGTPLPERVAGSELIWTLAERAASDRRSVFLLGGNPGTADKTASKLRAANPALNILGTECPPLGFEKDDRYLKDLENRLVSMAPDICILGLPSLKQDRLIRRLMIRMPQTWFVGIGVTFSFVAGEVRKAPPWVRRLGLEWCFRLVQEPRRLFRRYLVEGVPFAVRLFVAAAAVRFRGPRPARFPPSGESSRSV